MKGNEYSNKIKSQTASAYYPDMYHVPKSASIMFPPKIFRDNK